jgi:hypothetical protein
VLYHFFGLEPKNFGTYCKRDLNLLPDKVWIKLQGENSSFWNWPEI